MVSGIGFHGAGSILLRGEVGRGLTTAASLWSVAGIGLAVEGGMSVGVKPLERRFISVRQQRTIQLLAARGSVSLDSVHQTPGTGSVRVRQFIVQQSEDNADRDDVQIALSRTNTNECPAICAQLEAMSGVRECRCAN